MNALDTFQMVADSTTATSRRYIVDEGSISTDKPDHIDYSDNDKEGFIIDDVYHKSSNNELDLDDIMVSAVHGGRNQGEKGKLTF